MLTTKIKKLDLSGQQRLPYYDDYGLGFRVLNVDEETTLSDLESN